MVFFTSKKLTEAAGNIDCPVKIKLVVPPIFVLTTQTLDKFQEKHKRQLLVKEEPRAVSERDDKLLAEHMAKLNQDNEEVSDDEDSDEEEDTGMREVDVHMLAQWTGLLRESTKLAATWVAFWGGGFVRMVRAWARVPKQCKVAVAVAVTLSTAMWASMKGETATRYLPAGPRLAVKWTMVVWPGAIKTMSVLKGLVYTVSTSTTVSWWPAILKNSSSFSAVLMILNMYVFPASNGNVSFKKRH
ncbi:hypothetical protein QYF36_006675 [Acer negundo]|nr:hypothetical protein QYF36_006675 [Acer negundo]